jgi:hypothetical protein
LNSTNEDERMKHEVEEMSFQGDACLIEGVAVFDVEIHGHFDADIGGTDGREVTGCELIEFKLDGKILPMSIVRHVAGARAIAIEEKNVALTVQEMIMAGEI